MKENYYKPDTIWKIFGINTEEEFIDRFVIKGIFHSKVCEDISKSYKVVEHALALSYYHYPLYDLAIDKLLRIFEMAVNLRCGDLGIEKVYIDNKNKQRFKNLNQLIDELIRNGMIDDFRNILHNIREIRNRSSHQVNHTLIGAIAGQIFYPILNLLNLIFIDKEIHIENQSQFEATKVKILPHRKALFKLDHEGQNILAYDIDMHDCFKQGKDWIYIFSFMPVFTDSELRIKNHQPPERVLRVIKNVIIDDFSFQGFDLILKCNVFIERTDKAENILKLQFQLKVLNESEKIDAFIFTHSSKDNVDSKCQRFIYEYRWVNKNIESGSAN
jgi:hypothetical protein